MTLRISRRTESTTARVLREFDTRQTIAPQRGRDRRKFIIHHQVQVGKHLVSPLTRRSDCGQHVAAAVSIRSGRGSIALGPVLGGLIYDSFSSYAWLFIGAFSLGIGAFLSALAFTRLPRRRMMAAVG